MKLIHFSVNSDFKNLKGLKIFIHKNKRQDTYVLIGNNGAGKSSVLEALSSIFHSLFSGRKSHSFDFNLTYEMEGHTVCISHKNNEFTFKLDKVNTDLSQLPHYLPSRVICNYSGEETRIKDQYYADLYEQYISRIKKNGAVNRLPMVFIGRESWQIILLVMLACKEMNISFNTFLEETIGMGEVESIYIDIDRKELEKWTDNSVKYFINGIANRLDQNNCIELKDINPTEEEPNVVFNNLNSALPLIKDIRIRFKGGIDATTLSEGEKKLMVILFILESIADENSLVLLDEPDSHIHVARKGDLKSYFDEANRKNIITSHSPTLTAAFHRNSIIMLDKNPEGFARVTEHEKQEIVEKLTDGIWTLQQQNIFLASNKTILAVEGITDEQILDTALQNLKKQGMFNNLDFVFLPCGGANNIQNIIHKFSPKSGQNMIIFFDNDKAGWEAIQKIFDNKDFNSQNFGKARKQNLLWYTYYPKRKGWKGTSNFVLEDYFPRPVFTKYVLGFKGLEDLCNKKILKDKLAKDCITNQINESRFSNFKYVFERIEEILKAEKEGKEKI